MHGVPAGILEEVERGGRFAFTYHDEYTGPPISVAIPLTKRVYDYNAFPPFFDGLLPEGAQLEALLRHKKIDRDDYFSQIVEVGGDLVGAVTVEGIE